MMRQYLKDIKRTLNPDATPEETYMNMVYGMIGEFGELIDTRKKEIYQGHKGGNYMEEFGDFMWYLGNTINLLDMEVVPRPSSERNEHKLIAHVLDGLALLIARRGSWATFKPTSIVQDLYSDIITLADCYRVDLAKAKEQNIAKLQRRYPEGFSKQRSVSRCE